MQCNTHAFYSSPLMPCSMLSCELYIIVLTIKIVHTIYNREYAIPCTCASSFFSLFVEKKKKDSKQ